MRDAAEVGERRGAAPPSRGRGAPRVRHGSWAAAATNPIAPSRAPRLLLVLVALDLVAVSAAWLGCLAILETGRFDSAADVAQLLLGVAVIAAITAMVIASQGLYRSRVCAVRTVESIGLARAATAAAVIGALLGRYLTPELSLARAGAAGLLTLVFLLALRGLFRAWLGRARARGRFCRAVVLVGAGPEAAELLQLLEHHPELGLRVAGIAGTGDEPRILATAVPMVESFQDVPRLLSFTRANGVIVATSDVPSKQLNQLTRTLLRLDVHVQISSGLRGINHRRIRSLPLAHEPLFYLEARSLAPWQRGVKRLTDVTISVLLLVVSSPLLLLSALAIKLQDGGPVLFRQVRVGLDGVPFELLKLRTMVVDADAQLAEMASENQRNGPLFKVGRDPRRTSVGHALERTSIDELPQLLNVLRGEMSLVGPRPALPREVAEFDDALLGRQHVRPGITGLWQVEARDNPEFDVYRRLDLFYVENWSLGLDVAVMCATACAVSGRIVRRPTARSKTQAVAGAPETEPRVPEPRTAPAVRDVRDDFDSVLLAATAGEEWAFIELYRGLNPRLVRYTSVQAPGAGGEIAAEVWLTVARRLDTFVGDEAAFRAWLFTLARERVIQCRRELHGDRNREPDDVPARPEPMEPVAYEPPVDLSMLTGTEAAALVVKQLSFHEGDVVLLRLLGGLTAGQVAEILDMKIDAVYALESHALAVIPESLSIEAMLR